MNPMDITYNLRSTAGILLCRVVDYPTMCHVERIVLWAIPRDSVAEGIEI